MRLPLSLRRHMVQQDISGSRFNRQCSPRHNELNVAYNVCVFVETRQRNCSTSVELLCIIRYTPTSLRYFSSSKLLAPPYALPEFCHLYGRCTSCSVDVVYLLVCSLQCPHCDKSFLNSAFFQSHLQRRHPDEYEMCKSTRHDEQFNE